MSHFVHLGLGTNVGDRHAFLHQALAHLRSMMTLVHVSSIYETAAWGVTQQADFLNMCVSAETTLTPSKLLNTIKQIERNMGREVTTHWGPRAIDIDILLYADRSINEPHLTIPHAFLAQRAFVLVPLAEIAPEVVVPEANKTVAELLAAVETDGVRLVGRADWPIEVAPC